MNLKIHEKSSYIERYSQYEKMSLAFRKFPNTEPSRPIPTAIDYIRNDKIVYQLVCKFGNYISGWKELLQWPTKNYLSNTHCQLKHASFKQIANGTKVQTTSY
jgi:hypothetical protein